jgi:hypothetical protein
MYIVGSSVAACSVARHVLWDRPSCFAKQEFSLHRRLGRDTG